MDLFSSANVQITDNPLPDLNNWVEYFCQQDLYEIVKILKTIEDLRKQGKIIYPKQNDILRIFRDTRPDTLRIVILGQDPYFDGNATGYAFAVKKYVTPSLKKIWETINETCTHGQNITPTPSLKYLVDQGVMLLNTSLSVEANKPGSHKDLGWETIIQNFIKTLSKKKKGLIFMLWGNHAKEIGSVIDDRYNYVYNAVHPAFAARNNIKWKHTHFKDSEYDLWRQELPIIYWK